MKTYPIPDGSVACVFDGTTERTIRVERRVDGRVVWGQCVPRADVDSFVLGMTANPARYDRARKQQKRRRQLPKGAWLETLHDLNERPEPNDAFEVMLGPIVSSSWRKEDWMNFGWLMRPDIERARGEANLVYAPSYLMLIVREAER